MPKTRQRKEQDLVKMVDALRSMKGLAFSGFAGLTVNEANELRRLLRAQGVTLTVAKRTLFQRALKEAELPELPVETYAGGLQIAISDADEVTPAHALFEFAKKHQALELRGGILNGAILSKEQVTMLAKLPSRDQVRGQLVSLIAAPLRGLVTVLAGPLRGFVTVLHKRSEQSST